MKCKCTLKKEGKKINKKKLQRRKELKKSQN